MFDQLSKIENLHHAYLIEGGDSLVPEVLSALEARGIVCAGNPDVCKLSYMTLGVDDAHAIRRQQSEMAYGAGGKYFIVSADALSDESEDALLKTLEEPSAGTHFFFILPNIALLKDTFRSRFEIVKSSPNIEAAETARIFLSKKPKERLDMIAAFIKEHEDDEDTGRVRRRAMLILGEIEADLFRVEKSESASGKKYSLMRALEEILKLKPYLHDRGSSPKNILEHIALSLPTIK